MPGEDELTLLDRLLHLDNCVCRCCNNGWPISYIGASKVSFQTMVDNCNTVTKPTIVWHVIFTRDFLHFTIALNSRSVCVGKTGALQLILDDKMHMFGWTRWGLVMHIYIRELRLTWLLVLSHYLNFTNNFWLHIFWIAFNNIQYKAEAIIFRPKYVKPQDKIRNKLEFRFSPMTDITKHKTGLVL